MRVTRSPAMHRMRRIIAMSSCGLCLSALQKRMNRSDTAWGQTRVNTRKHVVNRMHTGAT